MILGHLEYDPYTVLCLNLVSKTFLSNLGTHSDPDKDWERRCRILGGLRKSPGYKTWKETYLQIVKKNLCYVL